jgi:hypothetical protein
MPPTPRAPGVRALLAGLTVVALVVLAPLSADARPADVPHARHHLAGSHLTNHHTHVETWIVGFYRYRREVRIHGHWRAKRFYGLRVSAQHCDRHHCWGPTVAGKLWSPHQPGRRVRSRSGRGAARVHTDLCLHGSVVCAAPWNWFARYIDVRQRELVHRFVNPCAEGGLAGGGVVAVKDLSARILFEGGVLTAAKAGSAFEGPPGIALGALAGCMVGEGRTGVKTVKSMVSALNPFDRGVGAGG